MRLLVTLIAMGMFAGAFGIGRAMVLRFLRWRLRRPVTRGTPPPRWDEILRRDFPLAASLTSDQRSRLLGHVLQLVDGCRWEGCGGLELTEEMQVLIAAQACLLVNAQEGDPYPHVDTILVYPGTFRPKRFSWTPSADAEPGRPTLGEAWQHGVVILAWDRARAGARNPFDGRNVVLHEFAHQLDGADGAMDGTPPLDGRSAYAAWAGVLEREFDALQAAEAGGRRTVLDHYGAENRAEFFAVATEAFFEKPRQLRQKHPELYRELGRFYRQDPAAGAVREPPEVGERRL